MIEQPAPPSHPWAGVYDHHDQVPSAGEAYSSEQIAQETAAATVQCRERLQRPSTQLSDLAPRDGGLLALLVAELATQERPVRVLDFGGGAGIDYLFVRALTSDSPVSLDYVVVELPISCSLGSRIHDGDDAIRFETAPPPGFQPDVVHASGALQYIADWKSLAGLLLDLRPKYFLLANTFVGAAHTFATAQMNLADTVVPYWFFAKADVVDVFASHGYALVLQMRTGGYYDQTNLPPELRTGRASNLLFRRRA